jgi:hypothetical protein
MHHSHTWGTLAHAFCMFGGGASNAGGVRTPGARLCDGRTAAPARARPGGRLGSRRDHSKCVQSCSPLALYFHDVGVHVRILTYRLARSLALHLPRRALTGMAQQPPQLRDLTCCAMSILETSLLKSISA